MRYHRRLACELLEDRRLLSGVTLVVHGADSDPGLETWVEHMDDAIAGRLDDAAVFTARVVNPSDPYIDYVSHDSGPAIWSNEHTNGEVIYKIDWSQIAFDSGVSTGKVAGVVADYLINQGVAGHFLAENPVHLIGHSRGGSLVGELARVLGLAGIWVDHVTTLDPHPVDGVREPFPYPDYGDAPMTAWENVVFWDNYWRSDGSSSWDFTGESVANTYDRQLVESRLEEGGYGGFPSGGEHSDVHLWYHGTIDTSEDPPANDGVYDVPNDWYGGSHPSRTGAGYYFSRAAGGTRPSEGLSSHVGGNAVRAGIDWTNAEWPNLLDFTIDTGQRTFEIGQPVPVAYRYHDADSNADTAFFFDPDRNPYNANAIQAGPSYVQTQTPNDPSSDAKEVPTGGIAPRTYYVSAGISDSSGHVRWVYAQDPVQIDVAPSADLGPVDFLVLEDLDPSAGDLWYRFQTVREGFLTAMASVAGGLGDVELALFDEDLGELASSSPPGGDERIDHDTLSGLTCFLRVRGTAADVDLRLANLVSHVGTVVTVYGTGGNDQFEFDAAASRRVVINGVAYEFEDAEVASVSFDGAAGDDTATLTGSADDETARLYPTSASWTGAVEVSVVDTAQITVHSGAGSDTAKLYDSPDDDMLIVTPDEASMTGPGYSNQVVGFGFAMGIAREDGYDTAKLDDSPGEDTFVGTPTYSKMSAGDQTYAYAKTFEHVIGYSRTGRDTAVLKDSPGDDKFVGRATYGKLSGPGFKVQAQWFNALEASANSLGNDRAYLFDSPGDDWFIADSKGAVMQGVGFRNRARWFESAYGYGTAGGMDRAIFYDSPGNDTFVGTSTRGRLTGPGYYLQAVRFDVVRAFSQSGGQDRARLFDSAGDDVLVATPEYSYLRGSPPTGNFKNRADGFAEVEATARFGGDDTARIYDSALDDYLHAEGNSAVITWDAARVLAAYDFDHVEADGSNGGVNSLKKVLPIDYLLTVTDPLDWIYV